MILGDRGKIQKIAPTWNLVKKRVPKTEIFWNIRLGAWICACEPPKSTQTTCYDHWSDLRSLIGNLDGFTTIFGIWGKPISPYHMEKSVEGMEAPKTKFPSTSYPKMFPNGFLCINYLSQSRLFGCGIRYEWFTVPKCASGDFSIWYGEMSGSKNPHFRAYRIPKCFQICSYESVSR